MSLLYIIYYYYDDDDDDDDDDDGTREAELILTQVISNNLDSNMETMETMGWQIVLMSRYLWPAKDSLSHDLVHMAIGQNYRRWSSQFLCGS